MNGAAYVHMTTTEGPVTREAWYGRQERRFVWQQGETEILYDLDGKGTKTVAGEGAGVPLSRGEREWVLGRIGEMLRIDGSPVPRAEAPALQPVEASGALLEYKVVMGPSGVGGTLERAGGDERLLRVDPATRRIHSREFTDWNVIEQKSRTYRIDTYVYPSEMEFREQVERFSSVK